MIIVSHDNEVKSKYCHLSELNVDKGDVVTKGHVIGEMGDSGEATGYHLHFQVTVNGKAVNPLNVVKLKD